MLMRNDTEWEQFRALDLVRLKGLMSRAIVIDLRNIYQPETMKKHGIPASDARSDRAIGWRRRCNRSKPFARGEPSKVDQR